MAGPHYDPQTGRWEFAPGDRVVPRDPRRGPYGMPAPAQPPTAGGAARHRPPPDDDPTGSVRPPPGGVVPLTPVRGVDAPPAGRPPRAALPAGTPSRPEPAETPSRPRPPAAPRRWPWVSAVGGAFLVGLVIPTGGGGPTVTEGPGDGAAPAASRTASASPFSLGRGSAPFTLEARSASGRSVDVVHTTGSGGLNEDTRPSGWTITVPGSGDLGVGLLTVTTGGQRTDTVTCRITDASGAVVAEETGTGRFASATCTGY